MTRWFNKQNNDMQYAEQTKNANNNGGCGSGSGGEYNGSSSSEENSISYNLDDDEVMEHFSEKSSLLLECDNIYKTATLSRRRQQQQQQQQQLEMQLKQLYIIQETSDQRHHIYRGAKRYIYFFLSAVLFFFLLFYVALYTNIQTRNAPHRDWGYNTSRNISDYVLPESKTNLLEPRDVCTEKVFLFILVCSSLKNFAARQMIRETWGNSSEFNYGLFQKMHQHLNGSYLLPSNERLKLYADYLKFKSQDNIVFGNSTMPTDTLPTTTTTTTRMMMMIRNRTNIYYDLRNIEVPVRVVFIVGRSKMSDELTDGDMKTRLEEELLQHNDIIQEDFLDTYNNLTIKSVLALKWIAQNCLHQSAFFMKCDDDTFVNVPNLLHFLLGGTMPIYNDTLELYDIDPLVAKNRLKITNNYLAGFMFCRTPPVANYSNKWYMPRYMWPFNVYPPYLSGAGYIMSNDVVPQLYGMAQNTTLVYLEDVYLTGICAQQLNLTRHHQPLFGYTRAQKLCQFKGTFTQHEMKDDSLYDAYAFVTNISYRCPPAPRERFLHRLRLHKSSSKRCL